MVLNSTPEQLTAIREVADCVRQKKILVSESDGIMFRRKNIVLRIIASATETDNRKRRQLIINHRLLARLLKKRIHLSNLRLRRKNADECQFPDKSLKLSRRQEALSTLREDQTPGAPAMLTRQQNGPFQDQTADERQYEF